ncbi:MupA/Atu3671 family FMN-dependent luciferase-like monooxygenase [Roseomonas sp. 18066]|uniref:MupA/Atu3671 family FMN-dependent luciferase-like monooxygenase n=1 Tax=Roseomonas sp. 18066 TaxID=2681412 RepID=UPI0013594850|nr:MupA/Atu3671 family FMN-dependent luciferase-like monooxygenase [Roseomonas sp. 18066]
MSAQRQQMIEAATRLWQQRLDAPGPAPLRPGAFRARRLQASATKTAKALGQLAFSLMFFSADAGEMPRPGLYATLQQAAREADRLGFAGLWLPERHFDPFGGPYPDPAVLAAMLAPMTRRIRLRAGSVVAPLHHPAAIAERWAMVDNLSGGRVDIAFGSGWNPRDFALAPSQYAARGELLVEHVEKIRRLWRGEAVEFPGPDGVAQPLRLQPRPLQPELPFWISSTGSLASFERAGRLGANLLTMLIGSELDALAPKIAAYRAARAAAGLDPATGTVTLMLHTLVHDDRDRVAAAIRDPFRDYLRSSLESQRGAHAAGRALDDAQRAQIAGFAAERYARSALFGTPEDCAPLLARVAAAGVDEVACMVDFGLPDALLLEGLAPLARLAGAHGGLLPTEATPTVAGDGRDAPIAVIGLSCRLPDAPDAARFWANLQAGRSALRAPPPGRGTALAKGGFLDDVQKFDAAGFGIAPAEAAAMDPHHRLMLEAVRDALRDAGLSAGTLRGSDTGIFAALYSTSFGEAAAVMEPDGVSIAGQIPSMAPNRISFLFDWGGPSELVNTACSSGLVALHRAAAALRHGECGVAVAAGASLLLSDAESAALSRLGLLSPTGACRAFDAAADGQARGEGVGALVLKPLAAAERDGDAIYAVLAGSAVNHGGARSGSLTLPGARRQAACIGAALRRAGVSARDIGYVEAHGAGSPAGDLAEASALEEALQGATPGSIAVGSLRPAIGSLDAAGGIAAAIKAALMLGHGAAIPPQPATPSLPEALDHPGSPLRFHGAVPGAMPVGQQAVLVHGYGLGGVNADLVFLPSPEALRRAPLPVAEKSTVGDFYDFVTRAEEVGEAEVFLTLAPFPEIVPGFSWTRCFQDPAANPAHWALMQQAQRDMRDVLYANVDFARVRRMLDIGCGLATDLMALATAHPALRADGHTISAAQAAAGRARVAARGLASRVAIHHRDSARDAFPAPEYDLVIGFEVAHHIRDKDGLFANIAAHLAPGGTLLLADTVANTLAPVDLPEVGAWTPDRDSYAALLARHGLAIRDWLDISAEIANFLADPDLEDMLATEARAAAAAGRPGMPLAAAVQRSWHAFGDALREGLMSYILVTAAPDPSASAAGNRAAMEAA